MLRTACRHQDSQESSGDDKMAPYRVRARAPSSGSERSGWHVEAHAPGRGMAAFCRHRTIPGCPDAYRRCCARSNPRLMRGAPSKRTAAAAHQARIIPCGARPVGIRTASNRPVTTKWRHTASGRVRLHTAPPRLWTARRPTRHQRAPHTPLQPGALLTCPGPGAVCEGHRRSGALASQGRLTGALSQALRGAWPDRPIFG